jgi:hypothetical protein
MTMAHLDSEKVVARILLVNGADRSEPVTFELDGEDHEIPVGYSNGLFLDVGDHIEVKYVSEDRLEIVTIKNGADEES